MVEQTLTAPLENPFKFLIRVYIEDTDAGGIVFYGNYLKFMERARTEFLRALGYHKAAVAENGTLLVVHSANIEYHRPARLDDILSVTCHVAKLARSYMEFQQYVYREQELLSTGSIRIACVNPVSMRPQAMPSGLYQQLSEYIESTQG